MLASALRTLSKKENAIFGIWFDLAPLKKMLQFLFKPSKPINSLMKLGRFCINFVNRCIKQNMTITQADGNLDL